MNTIKRIVVKYSNFPGLTAIKSLDGANSIDIIDVGLISTSFRSEFI